MENDIIYPKKASDQDQTAPLLRSLFNSVSFFLTIYSLNVKILTIQFLEETMQIRKVFIEQKKKI